MKIDVIVISSSRPQLLPYLVESFRDKVHFEGKMNIMLHEDFVFPKESEKVVKYAKESGFFSKIFKDDPNLGIGRSIQFMLNKTKSDYVFMLQDDGEFELPIDLGQLIGTMNKNPFMNCIYLNKRKNLGTIDGYKFQEHRIGHSIFLLYYHGPLGPGIGRTEFVKNRGELAPSGKAQEGGWNRVVKGGKKFDKETLEKVGSYIYGPIGFPRVIRHLGNTWVTKPGGKGSRNGNNYGGNVEKDLGKPSVQNRAPWLGEEPKRPMYTENKKEQIENFRNKQKKK